MTNPGEIDISQENRTEFRVQPNAALNHGSWLYLLGSLVFISLLIAVRFAWMGYWLILPYTILELSALGLVTWLVFRRNNYVEKIIVSEDQVIVQHLQKNHDQQWQFPRYWTQVKLESPSHRWYPHRLVLGSKGEWVEVGSCLTDDERSALASAVTKQVNNSRFDGRHDA